MATSTTIAAAVTALGLAGEASGAGTMLAFPDPHGAWWMPAATAEGLINGLSAGLREIAGWILAAYERTPALMLGLAALLALPVLAIAGALLRRSAAQRAGNDLVPDGVTSAAWPPDGLRVEVEGDPRLHCVLDRGMVRIGREADNELRLDHRTVHRYHAVIERTGEHRPAIFDVSGPNGNGVRLNGARIAYAMLRSGDALEIGAVRLQIRAEQRARPGDLVHGGGPATAPPGDLAQPREELRDG